MRLRLAAILAVGMAACVAGPDGGPFASRLDGPRAPTFAMDTTWLRLGGAPPAPAAGLQAYADWLARHPRIRALPDAERGALLTDAPLITARRALHAIGVVPRVVVDPLSLTAATNPTWSLPESSPIDATAAVIVMGASPNATTDRVIIEGADSPDHYIGVVSNMYGASPTVTKSASIGSRLDGSSIITNLAGTVAYAVTSAGVVYAINVADASTAWATSLGAAVSKSTPWLEFGGTGYLFVADLGGKVTALNPSTGAIVWSTNVTGGSPIHSSVVVIDNLVWIGADDGHLYRVDATTGNVVGQPTKLCLTATCTADDAIYSAVSGDVVGNRILVGVNRRIIEIDTSANGCTAMTTTACGYTAYPIQEGSFVAPAGRFEGTIAIDFVGNRVYFGYANRLWRAGYNAGITTAFTRAATDDPTGLLRGWNPTSHGFPRGIPFAFNNTIFVGDGGGIFHRFDINSWSESAWKSFSGGTFPGKTGPRIDSTALVDFADANVYFGVARTSNGEWDSLPQTFTSDAATAGTATRFRVATTGFATAGAAFNVTVTALDSTGARATGYTGTIRFASSDTAATLPSNYTFVAGDQGQRTFSVTLNTSGSQTLTAIDASNADLNGATGVCVGAGPCAPVVSADKSAYSVGERVVVSAAFLPGAVTDWVAVSDAGSAATSYDAFVATNGFLEGSFSFSGIQGGSYEPRVYASGGYTILDSGPTFTVTGSTSITTNASTYVTNQAITVSWTGAAGTSTDWIALAPDGAPPTTYAAWAYTGGAVNGSTNFPAGTLTPGTYRARIFFNGGVVIQAESAAFTVTSAGATTISTDASSYVQGAPVVVSWANALGSSTEWVAIAADGSPPTSYVSWASTGGAVNGSRSFTGLVPGTYRARLFTGSNSLEAESAAFTVTANMGTTVTTDLASYAVGAPIVVTWSGMLGTARDWVAIAPQGSPTTSYVAWVYTGGSAMGSHTFTLTLSPGTYVARAFFDDNFVLQDESPPFVVGP
jgi:hypothetical protein